ncbi:MAG: hypothetical protein ABIJ39_08970 [Chloroflexota bacterium]
MSVSRRDFMKIFGASIASLLLARCNWDGIANPFVSCYAPAIPPGLIPSRLDSARARLRLLWMGFPELAEKARSAYSGSDDIWDNTRGEQMLTDHRLALDVLVSSGEISAPVADLVHEAYAAAVYHTWRSNVPVTCYVTMIMDYTPVSADILIQQALVLSELASQGTIDSNTLATAQAALEHDLAFYALSEEDVQALYNQLYRESQPFPEFEDLNLELTPEAQAAAEFIIGLLTRTVEREP